MPATIVEQVETHTIATGRFAATCPDCQWIEETTDDVAARQLAYVHNVDHHDNAGVEVSEHPALTYMRLQLRTWRRRLRFAYVIAALNAVVLIAFPFSWWFLRPLNGLGLGFALSSATTAARNVGKWSFLVSTIEGGGTYV